MTTGTPQPPDEPAPAATPAPEPGATAAPAPGAPVPGAAAPAAVNPGSGTGFGVVALVLGGLGAVVPFLPADLGAARAWLPLPFVLPGLAIAIIGCSGPRRGNVWATVGAIVCAIAVGLSTVMLIAEPRDGRDTAGPGHTEDILRDELDVRFGERRIDPENGVLYVTVTLYNKGPYTASYGVTIEVGGNDNCEDGAHASRLAPGASYQTEIGSCAKLELGEDVDFLVTEASKDPYS